jgi:hypothetical protein
MHHTLPRPVPFIWQCVLRYHDQCLLPGNVSYGAMTSAFHMTMCHTVPRPVPFTCQCAIRYHDQCNMTMRHTVTQPVYFTCQYVIRYHDQCLSPGNVSYVTTTSAFHMAQRLKVRLKVLTRCTFSVTWESSVIFFRIQILKDDIKKKIKKNQKTKMSICTKRENVIGANHSHLGPWYLVLLF